MEQVFGNTRPLVRYILSRAPAGRPYPHTPGYTAGPYTLFRCTHVLWQEIVIDTSYRIVI